MNHKPNKISIGEHMIRLQMFMQNLSDKMPEISNTIHTIMEIKRKSKLNMAQPIVKEEADWEATTDQSLGESNLSIS